MTRRGAFGCPGHAPSSFGGCDADEAGFTLIELMISLALFGLIAMAGLALVDSLMGISERTEGRLDRLSEVQRAMYVIDNDLSQVSSGPLQGDSTTLSFTRPLAAAGGLPVQISYQHGAGTLLRAFRGRGLPQGAQRVLQGVGAVRWSYYQPKAGWVDRWPPAPELADTYPTAVAADIMLTPGASVGGSLRRVVPLPVHP
ncbi:MAG: prepilin-type N-terminal cleavage/methylation domain-containing protein [Pseudomonadota bacterium]